MDVTKVDIEDVLATWEADDLQVRAKLGPAGVTPPAQLASMSGKALFEAMFAGELPSPPIGETLDFIPIHIENGNALFQGRPGQACMVVGSVPYSTPLSAALSIPPYPLVKAIPH